MSFGYFGVHVAILLWTMLILFARLFLILDCDNKHYVMLCYVMLGYVNNMTLRDWFLLLANSLLNWKNIESRMDVTHAVKIRKCGQALVNAATYIAYIDRQKLNLNLGKCNIFIKIWMSVENVHLPGLQEFRKWWRTCSRWERCSRWGAGKKEASGRRASDPEHGL